MFFIGGEKIFSLALTSVFLRRSASTSFLSLTLKRFKRKMKIETTNVKAIYIRDAKDSLKFIAICIILFSQRGFYNQRRIFIVQTEEEIGFRGG